MSAAPITSRWRIEAAFGVHVIREARTDGGFEAYIASTWGDENIAHARLMAAAPELLEYVASSASNGCAEARRLLAICTGGAA